MSDDNDHIAAEEPIVIIGAGPAGLIAGYELFKYDKKCLILEATDTVGGISQTVNYGGYRFDIGGHRFFSKVRYVNELWNEILKDDSLTRQRLSRIYYKDKFFDYPLKPVNALKRLGPFEAMRIGVSYAKTMFFPSNHDEKSFEDWVVNRFGRRLFEIFFETYTEKVWGMPCSEISSDWAAQRIKNLSLKTAVYNALKGGGKNKDGEVVTTLIEQFKYPTLGPGMMWEKCRDILQEDGSATLMEHRVKTINIRAQQVQSVIANNDHGQQVEYISDQFISSMPLRELILSIRPAPNSSVVEAAHKLKYRDYLTVVLIVDNADVFPDNWIYIHSPEVKLGRIQNYKNWSPQMVDNENYTTLGLEYFLWEKDEEWNWSDDRLIELGIRECRKIGIISNEMIVDTTVVKMKKAYPVYDQDYKENLQILVDYVNSIKNLQTIGRNGQHRYNNQDHSMMTGVYAARNIMGSDYDVWSVNVEKEYHESSSNKGSNSRLIPNKIVDKEIDESEIDELFTTLDPIALAIAVGVTSSVLYCFIYAFVRFVDKQDLSDIFILLDNYLIGLDFSFSGFLIGLVQVFVYGSLIGYGISHLRNWIHLLLIKGLSRKYSRSINKDILEKI